MGHSSYRTDKFPSPDVPGEGIGMRVMAEAVGQRDNCDFTSNLKRVFTAEEKYATIITNT